jgi:hypothetical protein
VALSKMMMSNCGGTGPGSPRSRRRTARRYRRWPAVRRWRPPATVAGRPEAAGTSRRPCRWPCTRGRPARITLDLPVPDIPVSRTRFTTQEPTSTARACWPWWRLLFAGIKRSAADADVPTWGMPYKVAACHIALWSE